MSKPLLKTGKTTIAESFPHFYHQNHVFTSAILFKFILPLPSSSISPLTFI